MYERERTGVLRIVYRDRDGMELGGGSAFLVDHYVITNNHVYAGHLQPDVTAVELHVERQPARYETMLQMSPEELRRRLISGSDEQAFDYAILDFSQVQALDGLYRFELDGSIPEVGKECAIMGFPFGQKNVCLHRGYIASVYTRGIVPVIQVDASVNNGNSGGPLIDVATGRVIGIVSRKSTGLTDAFDQLERIIKENTRILQMSSARVSVGGIDLVQTLAHQQRQVGQLIEHIRRSANVGIGYAHSVLDILRELDNH